MRYTFGPNTDAVDRQVFYVDPDNGQIRLIDTLSTAGVTIFTVGYGSLEWNCYIIFTNNS